jgi:hypothetical protein
LKKLIPKFDIIDDCFGESLSIQPTAGMDIEEPTFFRAASEEPSKELLRGNDLNFSFCSV